MKELAMIGLPLLFVIVIPIVLLSAGLIFALSILKEKRVATYSGMATPAFYQLTSWDAD